MDYELDPNAQNSKTGEVILLSLKIYGSIFLVAFCIYITVRPKFPLAYNYCNSIREYNTKLAQNHFGHIQWIWKNFQHTDEEIIESCGLTACVFLRFIRLGMKVAAVGILNSFYLIPVNMKGCTVENDECNLITDSIERIGLGNQHQGSLGLLATTFAAYVIFGSTLYFIYNEFDWFTAARHKFLTMPRPDNYSVYVAHIPEEYRGDMALETYFRTVFHTDGVLQAKVTLDIYGLERKVAYREKIIQQLEHALNLRDLKSYEPTHRTMAGEVIPSIPFYNTELEKLNDQISEIITRIETKQVEERSQYMINLNESIKNHSPELPGENEESKFLLETNGVNSDEGGKHPLILDDGSNEKPVEEVATPNANIDQHRRDISDLPTHLSHEEPLYPKNSYDTFLRPLNEDEMMDAFINNNGSSKNDNEKNSSLAGLKKDPSGKSLLILDDDSNGHTDNSSVASKECEGGPQAGRETHQRNITSTTVQSSISSDSKKSKRSIHKTILKTTDGMKKSANAVQDGIKKSANVIHDGVKHSATAMHGGVMTSVSVMQKGVEKTVCVAQDGAKRSIFEMKEMGSKSIQVATALVLGVDDGEVRDGGFVTFTTLTAKAQCVQMIHHATPFSFHVTDAPLPKDIFWNNVGLPHKQQQIGYIIAQLLTAALCLFWTIPVAFVSSFSEVESLKKAIPSLEDAIAKFPWIQTLLAQLNPILIVTLKMLLPVILSKISVHEGHISKTTLNASLLTKLALFMIVQIFFVPAISGSIFASLPEIIEDWRKIIELLATSVPGQVKSFIQYVIVNSFLSCGFELLRATAVAIAFARTCVGPNLSEKERNTTFMGLKPLTAPAEMDFPMVFAENILYLMILLVYSCIAPIMSYVMLLIFTMLLVTYTNQFIFIYNAASDEGGVLWSKMVKIILLCMLIAQVTLVGIMSIKQSVLSSTLLLPLIGFTILFALYLEQEHYKVTFFLPSTNCRHADIANQDKLDKTCLSGQYVQPALWTKVLVPSSISSDEESNNISNESNAISGTGSIVWHGMCKAPR